LKDRASPSRLDLKPGDLVPVRRRTELDRIVEIFEASAFFRGYTELARTRVWMLSSPGELAAVKRAKPGLIAATDRGGVAAPAGARSNAVDAGGRGSGR